MDQQGTLQTTDDKTCDGSVRVVESVQYRSLNSAENASPHHCPWKTHQPNRTTVPKTAGALKHYGRRMKLNGRHGYNILVFSDGTVSTSDDDIDNHCVMEFTSMSPGHVRIKGVEANLFLAMDKNGQLYGEPNPTNNSTIFIEQPEGPYSAYLSLKYRHKKWYIAIKKNGQFKLGPYTKRGQHATHFLTIPV